MSKKEIITEIFKICRRKKEYIFDNELIKKVINSAGSKTNPYDMTKLDDTSKFPEILLKNDYFITHLGNGKHRFIKGIEKTFHRFDDEIINWVYRPISISFVRKI